VQRLVRAEPLIFLTHLPRLSNLHSFSCGLLGSVKPIPKLLPSSCVAFRSQGSLSAHVLAGPPARRTRDSCFVVRRPPDGFTTVKTNPCAVANHIHHRPARLGIVRLSFWIPATYARRFAYCRFLTTANLAATEARTTRSAPAALAELNDSGTQNGPRSVCSDWFGGGFYFVGGAAGEPLILYMPHPHAKPTKNTMPP